MTAPPPPISASDCPAEFDVAHPSFLPAYPLAWMMNSPLIHFTVGKFDLYSHGSNKKLWDITIGTPGSWLVPLREEGEVGEGGAHFLNSDW